VNFFCDRYKSNKTQYRNSTAASLKKGLYNCLDKFMKKAAIIEKKNNLVYDVFHIREKGKHEESKISKSLEYVIRR
jgi:hypothetical protein